MHSRIPVGLVALVLVALGGAAACEQNRASAKAVGGAPVKAAALKVRTVEVKAAPYAVEIPATGTLLARESVELVSELGRRLVRVPATEGAHVKKGELLFELDAADLEAGLAKLEVQIRSNRATLARNEKLVAEGVSATSDLELAQANLDGLLAERRILSVTLAKTRITAPFAGSLGLRRVSAGAWVTPTTVLARLDDTSSLKLDFSLPERYAGMAAVGGSFHFKVAGQGSTYVGRIAALDPSVDPKTRSILVRGEVAPERALLPGAFASVTLPIRVEQAIFIPALAVIPSASGRQVFVVEGNQARARVVEVGERSTDGIQVLSGLTPGDRVIVSQLLRLRDGIPVQIAPAP